MELSRSLVAALVYVGSIYLSNAFIKTLKKSLISSSKDKSTTHYKFTRDDPFVIKTRIVFVSLSTLIVYLYFFYYRDCGMDLRRFVFLMQNEHGFFPSWGNCSAYFKEIFFFIGLYLVLYMGELLDQLLGAYISPIKAKYMLKNFFSSVDIWFIRNYVFAPITEEIVFTLIVQEDYDNKVNFINSVIYFGIAHLHHGYELYVDETNAYSLGSILISCLFQMIYTSLFGHINNIIYSQKSTYSKIVNCICTHAICNYMGFPSLSTTGLYLYSNKLSKKITFGYEALHVILLLIGLYFYFTYMFF